VVDCLQVNARPGNEAERLKAAGNDAFKAKDWSSAVQLYRSAMMQIIEAVLHAPGLQRS
jgi:hypothetical protein